jgi:hypothetical protein
MDAKEQHLSRLSYAIVGFPRCRTSWLSNLLTYGDSVCLHEYLARGLSLPELPEGFKLGVCETNPFVQLPDVPTVCIYRDPQEVLESLTLEVNANEIIAALTPMIPSALQAMEDRAQRENTLLIHFNDIDSRIQEIIDHCGVCIPEFRTALLQMYRVEPMGISPDFWGGVQEQAV